MTTPAETAREMTILDEAAARALADFVAEVRRHYGARLAGMFLFGSRARGDNKPDSDIDVAVVLSESEIDFWREKMILADLAFQPIADSGIHVQGWPVALSAWTQPETHKNPSLVRAMRRDGRAVEHVGG